MPVSTVHFKIRLAPVLAAAFAASLVLSLPASASDLPPFKDDLFSNQTIVETTDSGDYTQIDYQEMRDINGRDQIPERRVKSAYVSLGVKKAQENETLTLDGRTLDVGRAGPATGAAFTVIFVHGRGGDRRLGMDDYRFGGNFNRLKNLAVENGGVYYAPSIRSFDAAGVADVAALIAHARAASPQKPVVLACASMGSFICWGITRDAQASAALTGMIIMGGASDPAFPKSAAYRRKLPIFFTHGGADKVYPAQGQLLFYRSLKDKAYPCRFVLYRTGSHGTPVRMTDWRVALNWIGVG